MAKAAQRCRLHQVQRTMLEIVNQLDGFDSRGNVKARTETSCGPCEEGVETWQWKRWSVQSIWLYRIFRQLTGCPCFKPCSIVFLQQKTFILHLRIRHGRSFSPVQVLMATNRPDTLDPALLRPGRAMAQGAFCAEHRLRSRWKRFGAPKPGSWGSLEEWHGLVHGIVCDEEGGGC